ncbi:MAG: 2-amino-4-hydroxy-6-hydroxymethyldihydropteridine diphosphokinase [Cellvibrionaceae bacterium]|nr:2-amino-4-hydroxy-6-hydroxymethyldihydropteridine diphosphokinase [Cellvibrionaceae bacterium]
MVEIYLGLGSNLKAPVKQIELALHSLNRDTGIRLLKVSPLYRSKPIGPQNQPDFINAVACVSCKLPPHRLLLKLQHIENTQGRKRSIRWGARTLDIDILLYGKQIIATPSLCIPHKEMLKRAFVLKPLADIDPELCLPDGTTVSQRLQALPQEDVKSLALVNRIHKSRKT